MARTDFCSICVLFINNIFVYSSFTIELIDRARSPCSDNTRNPRTQSRLLSAYRIFTIHRVRLGSAWTKSSESCLSIVFKPGGYTKTGAPPLHTGISSHHNIKRIHIIKLGVPNFGVWEQFVPVEVQGDFLVRDIIDGLESIQDL